MYRPLRAPRREELTVRGLKHRLTWWGEPSASPIVLLHGFMDTGATWQFLVDCLPASWTFVAPDWRGFGDTGQAAGGYWFADYLADLEALLEVLVPHDRARVVAHSMGANIVGIYAGVRPSRLAWFVNLEGIGLPRTHPGEAPERYGQWLDELKDPPRGTRYEGLGQLAATLVKRNPRIGQDRADFVAREWARGVGEDGVVRLRFDQRHRIVNPVLYRREEAEACWARIQIPMLLMMAGRSELMPRLGADAETERLRATYRDLKIVSIPDVGHLMQFEDPESVARHIVQFEQDLRSRQGA
jgi:pimeloyl-ACP methyl ester carboxylesterase